MADRICGLPFATRSDVRAPLAMAATSQPLATATAIAILREGGNAIDAAIAANAVLAVVEPTGCGIGGDLFAQVWDAKSSRLIGLNGSGRSPLSGKRAKTILQRREALPKSGPLTVTVPGAVAGWADLHERLGSLRWARILEPAIEYAEFGFPLSQTIAHYWERSAEVLGEYPGFADTFLPGGRAPIEGERFRNPGLAATLRQIQRDGSEGFYGGPIARAIADFAARHGAGIELEDLRGHLSDWVEPISTTYRGVEVWELGPNTQGIAVLQILNLIEPFDLRAMGFGSADLIHHLVEAKKLAYEDRARLYADPAFPRRSFEHLWSKDFATGQRIRIDPARAITHHGSHDSSLRHGDTVFLATADSAGNMVSLIQSNYRGFGSGLCPDGLGFCLQSRGEMFSLDRRHANVYAPGKRPFHTLIPGFATRDGKPWLAFGVMGGDMQPQGHVQILTNLIDFGMGLQEAGDAPRWYHTGSSEPTGESMTDGGVLDLESGHGESVRADLGRRGHRFADLRGSFGGYQAIARDPASASWIGASESRKDGNASGY